MPKINVAGLNDSDGEIFSNRPDGQYTATISGIELVETKETSKHPGSPMLKLTIKLDATDEFGVQSLQHYIVLPNEEYMAAVEMKRKLAEVKRLCIAGAIPHGDDFNTEDLLEQPLLAVVTTETATEGQYAGKEFNRISDLLPL